MTVSDFIRDHIFNALEPNERLRAKIWFKALLEAQYLEIFLRNHRSFLEGLNLNGPKPAPGPLANSLEDLSIQAHEDFMFQTISAQLKNKPGTKGNLAVVSEFHKTKDHIEILDRIIKSAEASLKQLKTERANFTKVYR